jgi:hypothetical protein
VKITKRQLRRIIKEEKRKLIAETMVRRSVRHRLREQLGAPGARIEINYDMGGMSFHHPDVEVPHSGYIERQPGWPDESAQDMNAAGYSPAERRFFADFVRDLANQTGATTIWDAETDEEQSIDEFVAQELSGRG